MKQTKMFPEWERGLAAYNGRGEEIPDPRRLEIPEGCERPMTLEQELAMFMGDELRRAAVLNREQAVEGFEDADDFDVEDEPEWRSPWEDEFEAGKVWTREMEVRAGVVTEPDYKSAKELFEKAKAVMDRYEYDEKGRAKGKKPAPQVPAS